MTNASSGRLDRIEILIGRSIVASDERMTGLEQSTAASDGRLTRIDGVIATNNQDRQEAVSRLAAIQRQVSVMSAAQATDRQLLCAGIAKHLGVGNQ